eukprot:1696860-Prorocentrum_lima.AAC.1
MDRPLLVAVRAALLELRGAIDKLVGASAAVLKLLSVIDEPLVVGARAAILGLLAGVEYERR